MAMTVMAQDDRPHPANKKRSPQYSLQRLLLVVALVAVCLAAWKLLSRRTNTISHAGWSYKETVPRFRISPILHSELEWRGSPVPESLATNGVTLCTPLGTFMLTSKGHWWRQACRIPLPPEGARWVHMTIDPSSKEDMPDFIARGYYETSALGVQLGNNEAWLDTQLRGTPTRWVYAYKTTPKGHIGYWADPERLDELTWD